MMSNGQTVKPLASNIFLSERIFLMTSIATEVYCQTYTSLKKAGMKSDICAKEATKARLQFLASIQLSSRKDVSDF